jgi:hypothetical protein
LIDKTVYSYFAGILHYDTYTLLNTLRETFLGLLVAAENATYVLYLFAYALAKCPEAKWDDPIFVT